jgi:hypothetical protein
MEAIGVVAAPVRRPGAVMVLCPHCSAACAVPAGRTLEGVACAACVRALAPEPAGQSRQALRESAEWWDRSRTPGAGYGIVTCPYCAEACVVAIGGALAATGCIGCLVPLGTGPLLRDDLVTDDPEMVGASDPGEARLSAA